MSPQGGSGSQELAGAPSATAACRKSFVSIDCRVLARRDIDVGTFPGAWCPVRHRSAPGMPARLVLLRTFGERGCPNELVQRRGRPWLSAASSCATSGVARHG